MRTTGLDPRSSADSGFFANTVLLGGLLVLCVFFSFLFNLDGSPLIDRDEGEFSEITREMFVRNDFISIFVNDKPSYDKPILIYWCQAMSYWAFGLGEFAFRFPSAVFSILWVWVVYRFVRKHFDVRTGLIAGVFMSTSLWVTIIGRAAIADALLNLLLTLTMFDVWEWLCQPRRGVKLRIFLWVGLGFLTKGPIAVILPFVVTFVYLGLQRRWGTWIRLIFDPLGILIFLAITAPWYIAQYLRQGQDFIDGFFGKHNVGRFSKVMEKHGGGFWYYIPFTFLILLPHSTMFTRLFARTGEIARDALGRYLLIWFGFVFLFFSISATKLPHYVLYGFVPLFIFMAIYRHHLTSRFWALFPGCLLLLLFLLVPEFLSLARPYIGDPQISAMLAPEQTQPWFGTMYRLLTGVPLILALVAIWLRRVQPWQLLMAMGLVQAIIVTLVMQPAVGGILQGPIVEAGRFARAQNLTVRNWGLDNPSFSIYAEKVTVKGEPEPGIHVVTNVNRIYRIREYEVLFERGGIVIAKLGQNLGDYRKKPAPSRKE